MVSMRSIYALKALSVMARTAERESFLIVELAAAENIPKKFLEAILLSLKVKGFLSSKKGPKGGYSLARSPEELTVGSILEALEGDLSPIQCLNGTGHTGCPKCTDDQACGVKLVMADVKESLSSLLYSVTLADMLEKSEYERQKIAEALDYSI